MLESERTEEHKWGVWVVERENDTGPDDGGYCEWWDISDGETEYRTYDGEDDAQWLCDLLNAVKPPGDLGKVTELIARGQSRS